MSPRLVATVVALLLFSPSASAQTVPALAGGVPPQVAPHPINVPAPPDPVTLQKLGLLRERIVQRDQIQREIDQLIVETKTPQVMKIYLELLEINVTAADAYREKNLPDQPVVFDPKKTMWGVIELDKLREAGIATSLARPQLMVLSGQQASSRVGNSENSSVTEVQLRADSLGNNRVFIDLYVERVVPTPGKKNGTNAEPPRRFSISNPSLELTFDEPSLLSGLRSKEKRTRRGALGRVTEEVTTETVLLITAEGVMPRQADVVPATAIAPR
jgi:hypothetical protein